MPNVRDRNIDSSRRDDRRAGTTETVVVTKVYPHKHPYSTGDRDFNVVDVQLINRVRERDGSAPIVKRVRVKSLYRGHSYLQGEVWNPRIGDCVIMHWINDREAIILGQIVSAPQEPICRSEADEFHQPIVQKTCSWAGMPKRDPNTGDFVAYPKPNHPDCKKRWPVGTDKQFGDNLFIFDCQEGHHRPWCDDKAPCTKMDDHQLESTFLKVFSVESPTEIDLPGRVRFHHRCGSDVIFDLDGSIFIGNANGEKWPDLPGTERGHIYYNPLGTIDIRSELEEPNGARARVVADEDQSVADEHGEIAAEMTHLPTQATVRIYKDGCIKIRSGDDGSEVYLGTNGNCWLWNIKKDTYIEFKNDGSAAIEADSVNIIGNLNVTGSGSVQGSFSHGDGPCCGISAEGGWL